MPKSVTLFGRKIPVKIVDAETMAKIWAEAGGSGVPFGLWDCINRVIYLLKSLPRREKLYTLYHEMGHACLTFTGLDLILDGNIQELLVQSYATLIEDILKMRKTLAVA
jgi:Zn-dependent peptidase ImmA (M78 family)